MALIRKILVPTDFSACARRAARFAVELAKPFGAQITLLHVLVPPVYAVGDGGAFLAGAGTVPFTAREMSEQAERELGSLARELGDGVRMDTRLVEGTSAEAIAQVASVASYDLIVLGTHGRSGLSHLLLGSVAERVVRIAPCPVVTVREEQRSVG